MDWNLIVKIKKGIGGARETWRGTAVNKITPGPASHPSVKSQTDRQNLTLGRFIAGRWPVPLEWRLESGVIVSSNTQIILHTSPLGAVPEITFNISQANTQTSR